MLPGMDASIPVGWLFTPGRTPLRESVDHVVRLERRGFEHVWMGEAWREVVVPLAAMAGATDRIALASGILQVYPVNPVMVAQQAAQLAELSGGRFALRLGLGAGFVVERWFGVRYERPLQRMREFLQAVRGVLGAPEDGPFSFEGEVFRVRNYPLPFLERRPDVRIHLAAVGPKMQQLAGELADGIVVGGVNSPAHMDRVLENLAIGAARAGRDPAELEVVYAVPCAVWPDNSRALELAKGSLVYTTQYPHYLGAWKDEGHGEVTTRIAEHVRRHEMDAALALVPDELMERYAVYGTPAECARQLERYRAYPGRPILSLMPFRMSDEEVMASLRLGADELPTHL